MGEGLGRGVKMLWFQRFRDGIEIWDWVGKGIPLGVWDLGVCIFVRIT